MKKKLCLIFFFALSLGFLLPSFTAKAASKTAPNNVKSIKETYYDAVLNLLNDGKIETLFRDAEYALQVPYDMMATATKFAIVNAGEDYPLLLISGAKTKSDTWYLKPENTLETLHIFKYDEERGGFVYSKLEVLMAPLARIENYEVSYANIFLNSYKGSKGVGSYFTTVTQIPGEDAFMFDVNLDWEKYSKYTDPEKLVDKLIKDKACQEIKWFKTTDIKGFKKAYKGVVKKVYKDKRNSYYADEKNPISYLPYKITGGTISINKYKEYTEYVFKKVNSEDYSSIHLKALNGAYIKIRDGASATDTITYYFVNGKKVSGISVTSYYNNDGYNISIYKPAKMLRGTIYYALNIEGKERKKCEKMSDYDFVKYLKKNYSEWVAVN